MNESLLYSLNDPLKCDGNVAYDAAICEKASQLVSSTFGVLGPLYEGNRTNIDYKTFKLENSETLSVVLEDLYWFWTNMMASEDGQVYRDWYFDKRNSIFQDDLSHMGLADQLQQQALLRGAKDSLNRLRSYAIDSVRWHLANEFIETHYYKVNGEKSELDGRFWRSDLGFLALRNTGFLSGGSLRPIILVQHSQQTEPVSVLRGAPTRQNEIDKVLKHAAGLLDNKRMNQSQLCDLLVSWSASQFSKPLGKSTISAAIKNSNGITNHVNFKRGRKK